MTAPQTRWASVVVVALVLAGCGGSTSRSSSATAPRRTPAPPTDVASVAARADVPVLCYHQIRPPTARDAAAARPYIVAPAALAKQMRALDDAGFHTVTGDQL